MKAKCNRVRVSPKPTFEFDEKSILSSLHAGGTGEVGCPYCGNIGIVVRKARWHNQRDSVVPTKGHAKIKEEGITRIKLIDKCTPDQKKAIGRLVSQEMRLSCHWDGDLLVIVSHLALHQTQQLQKMAGIASIQEK